MVKAMKNSDELEYGSSLAGMEAFLLGDEETKQHPTKSQRKQEQSMSSVVLLSDLRESICNDMLGDKTTYPSPFLLNCNTDGPTSRSSYLSVPLIYCDHTATHRSLQSIESFLSTNCLPILGNTHTTTSMTGCQSTSYVAEARQIVAECVNAKVTGEAATDVVLFTGGTGVTSAVELLIDILNLSQYKYSTVNNNDKKPIIFVGPFEHHSNLVPWRESGCEIVSVPIHPIHGGVHLEQLECLLANPIYGFTETPTSIARLRIGTFSAASNVTGRVTDTQTITTLLHKYQVLSFWDYATGASYLPIDMNPGSVAAALDAVFLSPHKVLGGSGGSVGILIVKKCLISPTQPPSRSGGGTVFYVTNQHHRFLSNPIDRYEGGSPNIPGIIRVGLTFLYKKYIRQQLRQQALVTTREKNDSTAESGITREFFVTWSKVVDRLSKSSPNLIILGSSPYIKNKVYNNANLPIFSFLIQCGSRFLHHNFVSALLNDMFGIQTRGGCQCAGPYSQFLLGLTTDIQEFPNESNQRIEDVLVEDKIEILRVGFTRLSLPYLYMREVEMEYVLKALEFTAKHGWKFLCQYQCNLRTGEWRHNSREDMPLGSDRKWLQEYTPPLVHLMDSLDNENRTKNSIEEGEECCQVMRLLKNMCKFPTNNFAAPFLSVNSNDNNENSMDDNVVRQPNDIKSLAAWKDFLDDTLENANILLQQVEVDTNSLVQVMKATTDNDDLLPSSVEDLRWYIYPRECARMLYEGVEPTFLSNTQPNILGAVQPLERVPLATPTN